MLRQHPAWWHQKGGFGCVHGCAYVDRWSVHFQEMNVGDAHDWPIYLYHDWPADQSQRVSNPMRSKLTLGIAVYQIQAFSGYVVPACAFCSLLFHFFSCGMDFNLTYTVNLYSFVLVVSYLSSWASFTGLAAVIPALTGVSRFALHPCWSPRIEARVLWAGVCDLNE